MLRCPYPSLALLIQNLTAGLLPTQTTSHSDTWVAIRLSPEEVNAIATALTAVADLAGGDCPTSAKHRVAIHRTLLAWLNYMQSFLDQDPAVLGVAACDRARLR